MPQNSTKSTSPIFILGTLFFIFGFVTWLNGTLIPYLRIACELNTFQSMLVAFAFYISYFVMALPSSIILQKTGLKKGMMLGLFIMSIGALIFIPAALTRTYWMFLSGLFIIGTGLSLLQTASNPYITIVGPIESAAKRISIMGICNKVAGVLAPLILGSIILSDADVLVKELETLNPAQTAIRLDELAGRVIFPYLMMSIALVFLAFIVRFSSLPEIENKESEVTSNENTSKSSILQFPNLILGIISLFLYVGVEVIAGDTIGSYGRSLGIPLSEAKNFTSYTLAAMVLGYIVGIIFIPKYLSQEIALAGSAIIGIILSLCIIFTREYASVLCLALTGLANALVWPAIWPLAIKGLGKFTKIGSALLIMAIAGGAVMPLVYGQLASKNLLGDQNAYLIMIPCYGFILFYALRELKIKNSKSI